MTVKEQSVGTLGAQAAEHSNRARRFSTNGHHESARIEWTHAQREYAAAGFPITADQCGDEAEAARLNGRYAR